MPITIDYPEMNAYTPTPVDTTTDLTTLDPTAEFKTSFIKIIEAITLLTDTMSYEPKTVLLQLEGLRQELKDTASKYQSAIPNPSKFLLGEITTPLKINTRHLQYHHYHTVTSTKLNTDLNANTDHRPQRFHKANKYTTTTCDIYHEPITISPADKSTLATLVYTPEDFPTFLSTLPSRIPLEATT